MLTAPDEAGGGVTSWNSAVYNGGIDLLQGVGVVFFRIAQILGIGLVILGDRLVSRRLKDICEDDELQTDDDREKAFKDVLIRRYNIKYTLCGVIVYSTFSDPISTICSEWDAGDLVMSIWAMLLIILLVALRMRSNGSVTRFFYFRFPRLVYLLVCVVPSQVVDQLSQKYDENAKNPQV